MKPSRKHLDLNCATHQQVVRGENDEEPVEVLAKPLPHEDEEGDHVVHDPHEGDEQEEGRVDLHAEVVAASCVVMGPGLVVP